MELLFEILWEEILIPCGQSQNSVWFVLQLHFHFAFDIACFIIRIIYGWSNFLLK